jgi:hypothetical protein
MSCHQPRVWIGNAGDVSSGSFSFLNIIGFSYHHTRGTQIYITKCNPSEKFVNGNWLKKN